MPFTCIHGTYRLVGKRNGHPSGFSPDGDSIQFHPDKSSLLNQLQQLGTSPRLTSIGSLNLRLEAIDALELHFPRTHGGNTHQPRPLADEARDLLTRKLAMNPVPYRAPDHLTVLPPVPHD